MWAVLDIAWSADAENAGPRNTQDRKMRDQKNDGPNEKAGKCRAFGLSFFGPVFAALSSLLVLHFPVLHFRSTSVVRVSVCLYVGHTCKTAELF